MEKVMSEEAQDKPKNFSCTLCEKKFFKAFGLKKHLKTHNQTHFICNFCNQSFNRKSSYNKHLKNHCEERKPYSCSACEESFSHAGDLLHHLRECSKEEPYLWCKICNTQYYDEIYFKMHMKIHSRNPFACSLCPCIFNSQNNLNAHMKFHLLKLAEHEFKSCEKVFTTKTNLKNHKRVHSENALVCSVCKTTFSNIRKFDDHVKSHSQGGVLNSKKPSECASIGVSSHNAAVNLFKCDICEIHCFNSEDLKNHISSHTGADIQNSILVQQASTDMGIYVDNLCYMCDICEKYIYVKSSTDLDVHKKSHLDLDKTEMGNNSFDQICVKSENVYADDVLDFKNPSLVNNLVTNSSNYYDRSKENRTVVENNDSINKNSVENCSICERDEKKSDPPAVGSEESFICDLCHGFFSSLEDLKTHEEIHSKTLIPHQDLENVEKDSEAVELGSVNDVFTCDVCKNNFICLEHLEKHSKIHIQKMCTYQGT